MNTRETIAALASTGIFSAWFGYWAGAWHLLWANASFEKENADLRARLKLWERGWIPRDWKNPRGPGA